MKYIKYIIIFTFSIALGMLYVQLLDYEKITKSLLKEHKTHLKEIKNLHNQNLLLETENKALKNNLVTIQESLEDKIDELGRFQAVDTNLTNVNNAISPYLEGNIPTDADISQEDKNVSSTITNDENKITGFSSTNN